MRCFCMDSFLALAEKFNPFVTKIKKALFSIDTFVIMCKANFVVVVFIPFLT